MKVLQSVTVSLFGVLVLLSYPSSILAQGPCDCTQQNKTDLESRIDEAKAAISNYQSQIKQYESQGKDKELLNGEIRKGIQDAVSVDIGNAKHAGATKYPGVRSLAVTSESCKVSTDPAVTPCLRKILEKHEAVHKAHCDKYEKDGAPDAPIGARVKGAIISWRYTQKSVDYMKEEIESYKKEIEELNNELNNMKANCAKFTQIDGSLRATMEQAFAQRERLGQSYNRLGDYAQSLN